MPLCRGQARSGFSQIAGGAHAETAISEGSDGASLNRPANPRLVPPPSAGR
jgi:hypothetical protein